MNILGADAGHIWYDNPIVVAVVTVTLTLLATQLSNLIDRRHNAKRQAKILRMGFLAEVENIQRVIADVAEHQLEHHEEARATPRELPTKFYEANVGRLGDLDDPDLSKMIVHLYSGLSTLQALGQEAKAEDAEEMDWDVLPEETDAVDRYLSCLFNLDYQVGLMPVFLSVGMERTDAMIDAANEMLERYSKILGKPAGKVFRDGKKTLGDFQLVQPESWSPRKKFKVTKIEPVPNEFKSRSGFAPKPVPEDTVKTASVTTEDVPF